MKGQEQGNKIRTKLCPLGMEAEWLKIAPLSANRSATTSSKAQRAAGKFILLAPSEVAPLPRAAAAISLHDALPCLHKEPVFLQGGKEKNAQFLPKAMLIAPCSAPSLSLSPQIPPLPLSPPQGSKKPSLAC